MMDLILPLKSLMTGSIPRAIDYTQAGINSEVYFRLQADISEDVSSEIESSTQPSEPEYTRTLDIWDTLSRLVLTAQFIINELVKYILWQIVWTLVIVEEPHVNLPSAVKRKTFENPSHDENLKDEVSPKSKQCCHDGRSTPEESSTTITSSVHATVRLLLHEDGVDSLFRGLASLLFETAIALYTSDSIIHTAGLALSSHSQCNSLCLSLVRDLTLHCLLCQVATARTHIVITRHSFRTFFRRFPPFWPTFRATVVPRIMYALACSAMAHLPPVLYRHYGVEQSIGAAAAAAAAAPIETMSETEWYTVRLAIWLLIQLCRFALYIPISAALARVEASLLPEDEETIVPFDRTFGMAPRQQWINAPAGSLSKPTKPLSWWAAMRSVYGPGRIRSDGKRIVVAWIKLSIVEFTVRLLQVPIFGEEALPMKQLNPFW